MILRLKTSMSVFYPKNYEDFKNKIFRNLNVTESQKINQKRWKRYAKNIFFIYIFFHFTVRMPKQLKIMYLMICIYSDKKHLSFGTNMSSVGWILFVLLNFPRPQFAKQ